MPLSVRDPAAVAGFRTAEFLAWGRTLYVDDLVTEADRHANRVVSLRR